MKILIVDDDRYIRVVLKQYLQYFDTVDATNGYEALQIMEYFTPDIILLDIQMPMMNGWQVLDEIRTNPKLSNTSIALVTSEMSLDGDELCYYNVDKVFDKPLRLKDILLWILTKTHTTVSKSIINSQQKRIQ